MILEIIFICTYRYMRTYRNTSTYRCMRTYRYMCTYRCMRTYMYTHIPLTRAPTSAHIWGILDTLRSVIELNADQNRYNVDKVIADNIVAHILELNSICSDRMGMLHSRIHPLKLESEMSSY